MMTSTIQHSERGKTVSIIKRSGVARLSVEGGSGEASTEDFYGRETS